MARRRPHRRSERGVALFLALISIAILTVVGTEFAYNSRVDLQLAANQRDEMRAYFLAKSGIGLGRLLLKFQKQMDSIQLPDLGKMMQNLMGTPPAGGGQTPAPSSMSIQLWRMAKIDCYLLQSLVPQGEGGEEADKL